jgi:hypothetical protein
MVDEQPSEAKRRMSMFNVARGPALFAALAVGALLFLPSNASAQSAIAGVVKDTSGAVLPGVTVEASSPVLIEKTRSVVTDGQGQYKIVDLRPGTYRVVFGLPGFNTVQRDGIELTANFTASVNADLRVGAVEESITVSGSSPTVDVQNVVQQKVLTRDVIDNVPVGTKTVQAMGVLIPGITSNTQDVGGTGQTAGQLAVHGSRGGEEQLLMDGMTYNTGSGRGGAFAAVRLNEASTQEIAIEVSGFGAENEVAAVRTNAIPKEGGNRFTSYGTLRFANQNMAMDNLTDEQKVFFPNGDSVKRNINVAAGVGGPIVPDRLWFYSAYQVLLADTYIGGRYYNLATNGHSYVPDLSRQAYDGQNEGGVNTRLTWQVTSRNKLNLFYQSDWNKRTPSYGVGGGCAPNGCPLNSPEAVVRVDSRPQYMGQTTWTSPITNRLLLQAGAVLTNRDFVRLVPLDAVPGAFSYTELNTGVVVGNSPDILGHNAGWQYNTRVAASYVTGSHNVRVGTTFYHAQAHTTQEWTGNGVTLQLLNGVPNRVTQFATPVSLDETVKANVGVFAQDQWTIKHLTLNLGVRFDYQNMYVPAGELGPGPNTPTRQFRWDTVENVPNWKDVTPRLGFAYDLRGDGKTAIKGSIGKFLVAPAPTAFARLANPAGQTATNVTRQWTDSNNNFLADCNFAVLTVNGECGQVSNLGFGSPRAATRYLPDAVDGNRGYNWEGSIGVQHELFRNTSLNVAGYRRTYGNFLTTAAYATGASFVTGGNAPIRNQAVTPANYTSYCVPAPPDTRLPNGGGYQVCGLTDINAGAPAADNVVTLSSNFGDQSETFTGWDININTRLWHGANVAGGTSTGRVVTDTCFVVNSVGDLVNCHVEPPFQTQIKILGSVPLPWWGLRPALTFQSLPGPQQLANWSAPSSVIAPSLGRNLTAGANATAIVPLITPGTLYGDRLNQLDFRMAKAFSLGSGRRIEALFDVYNMLNASPVLSYNNTYGPAWLNPTSILAGRLFKVGVQINY